MISSSRNYNLKKKDGPVNQHYTFQDAEFYERIPGNFRGGKLPKKNIW